MFIAKIGGRLFITNDLIRRFYSYTSMISCQNDLDIFISNFFQCLVQWANAQTMKQ